MKKILLLLATAGTLSSVNAQTNCAANFTHGQNTAAPQFQVTFGNTSAIAPSTAYTASGYLDFGDGSSPISTMPNQYTSHYYNNYGTYNVTITNTVTNNATQQVVCTDTFTTAIIVYQYPFCNLLGVIHPYLGPSSSISYYKLWLIVHDSVANTLTAVDSIQMAPGTFEYKFEQLAPGNYLLKVKPFYSGPAPAYGYVPTYHDSSIYWNGAAEIVHTVNGSWANVWLLSGTQTSGPGFVGGSISQGAGKGTGTGIPDMLVFLRNNTDNKMIASTYTDVNGNYSFSNIPEGSYNVYPEEMNYATTPSGTLNITNGQANSTGVDFTRTDDAIFPGTLSIAALSKNDGIRIYPNPVADQLLIENKEGIFNRITIVNSLGQVIKQESVRKGNNKIETKTLSSGMYYIIVNGVHGARSIKITKE